MKLFIVLIAVIHGCLSASLRQTCPQICPFNYDPQCGSDGQTYGNECALNAANCVDPTITLAYAGQCTSKRQLCGQACAMIFDPVCGSDGKTYSNKCMFDIAHCNDGLTIVKSGSCDGDLLVS